MARRHTVTKDVKHNYLPVQAERALNIARATGFYGVSPERRSHPGVNRRMREGEHNFSGDRRESQPRVDPMPVCFPDSGFLRWSEAKAAGRRGSFEILGRPFTGAELTSERPSDAAGEWRFVAEQSLMR